MSDCSVATDDEDTGPELVTPDVLMVDSEEQSDADVIEVDDAGIVGGCELSGTLSGGNVSGDKGLFMINGAGLKMVEASLMGLRTAQMSER